MAANEIFERRVKSIAERFKKDNPDFGLDLQSIIDILSQFLPLLLGFCKKSNQSGTIVGRARKPGALEEAAVYRALRNECNQEPNCPARRALRQKARELTNAIFAEAKATKEDEAAQFLDQATQYGDAPDLMGI